MLINSVVQVSIPKLQSTWNEKFAPCQSDFIHAIS